MTIHVTILVRQIDMNHDSDPKEEAYWETVEAVTNYESESEEKSCQNSSSENEEEKVIIMNNDLDSEEEIYWEATETFANFELEPEKIGYSQIKEEN